MNAHRVLVGGLAVALGALPCAVGAQGPSTAQAVDSRGLATSAYACVDLSDASARRWFQDEPCGWPMVHLPVTAGAGTGEPRRWPAYPPKAATAQDGHAMFWRFPVQPMGPHEVPRHSWR